MPVMINKNDYSRTSSGHIISFGDSQCIISFHCFIVTWVILLYTSLLWIHGSYCIRIILTRVILLYWFHCVWKCHCHYFSVDAHAKNSSLGADPLTQLFSHVVESWNSTNTRNLWLGMQNHCQKLASRPMRSLEKLSHWLTNWHTEKWLIERGSPR